ncbi:diguanylate phosphodiesterase [Pseudodesulfovibrio mercurii]|uniref:Diguanylate phosphodiesterase n=1 Tax=Pseudodesulfovibrio mercurii TaxID=641491 RepID=F0JJ71_9BACT|nr:EAL domain-containing protein [Pseudodesulfovibrio mercurii]EGB15970.1 diguanylate phosphodiesterase [Pseudodesulfovibrio mercurii]
MAEQAERKVDEQTIREILNSGDVTAFFQPVVSITTKSIIGFEVFSRAGRDSGVGSDALFNEGLSPDITVEVDRLCRARALEQFKPIHAAHDRLLLFLNINPKIFPQVGKGSMVVADQARAAGIDPANVVLECPMNTPYLDAIEHYSGLVREAGFSTCFDNCAVDHPFSYSLNRVRPGYVKINRSFFAPEDGDENAGRTLEAFMSLARRVGCVVVAQCVESEEESLRLLEAGVNLQQGYYYTKEDEDRSNDPARLFFDKVAATHDKYKALKHRQVRGKKELYGDIFRTATAICNKLANLTEDRFEEGCRSLVQGRKGVISLFVVDDRGVQVTRRIHTGKSAGAAGGTGKGADLSAEDYVLYLDMGYDRFVTPPFLSPYTGGRACLVSRPFFSLSGLRYTACMEMSC